MKRKLFFNLILFAALTCFIGSGCGSSSTSTSSIEIKTIISDEYAYITRDDILHDNTVIIDTENSEVSCDSSGENCYRFATRYEEFGSQITAGIMDSSGHRFFFVFVDRPSGNTVYEYIPGVEFTSQSLRMNVSYDSPDIPCGDGCYNVYNYTDMVSCNSNIESCKYYKVTVLANSDDSLEFVFSLWNRYFLDVADVPAGADRGAVFQGHIKIKKSLHNGNEDYYHTEND